MKDPLKSPLGKGGLKGGSSHFPVMLGSGATKHLVGSGLHFRICFDCMGCEPHRTLRLPLRVDNEKTLIQRGGGYTMGAICP